MTGTPCVEQRRSLVTALEAFTKLLRERAPDAGTGDRRSVQPGGRSRPARSRPPRDRAPDRAPRSAACLCGIVRRQTGEAGDDGTITPIAKIDG